MPILPGSPFDKIRTARALAHSEAPVAPCLVIDCAQAASENRTRDHFSVLSVGVVRCAFATRAAATNRRSPRHARARSS